MCKWLSCHRANTRANRMKDTGFSNKNMKRHSLPVLSAHSIRAYVIYVLEERLFKTKRISSRTLGCAGCAKMQAKRIYGFSIPKCILFSFLADAQTTHKGMCCRHAEIFGYIPDLYINIYASRNTLTHFRFGLTRRIWLGACFWLCFA